MNTQEISANADNISLVAAADHSKLCDIWPTVKEGLEILSTVIKNPVVKVVISTVISGGRCHNR